MGQKQRIGWLYGKPIMIGDKNIIGKNEIHIHELGNPDNQDNSKGYLWYDFTAATTENSSIKVPFLESLPYISGALVAGPMLEGYTAVLPMTILTSGLNISEQTYLGLPEYVYYNDEVFNILDFINTIMKHEEFQLSKNDFEKYLVPSSKVFTNPIITMAGV